MLKHTPSLKFIPASSTEQLQLMQLLATEIWHEHYVPIIGLEQVTYMLEKFNSVAALQQAMQQHGTKFFLIENEQAIGYIGIVLKKDTLFLDKLYVQASQRGQKIGRQAIDFVCQICQHHKLCTISLRVNKYNSNSIAFYHKLGFETMAEDVLDIGQGYVMDDYIMQLKLNTQTIHIAE